MVFKSSRLPYRIDVATDADAARQYLENNANARQMDLIFLDTVEILHHVAVPIDVPAFLLMKVLGEETGARAIEKPFTQQKLLDCLSEAGLDAWASRLAGKSIETATAA
jgi:hypothetical protein